MMLQLPVERILALLIAISFAAGLNVYATVATLGLLAHTGRFPLPEGLSPLGNWYVIAASLVLFCVEFFGDKIPAFDLLWNALHTFIRIPIAALLAFRATASLPPWEQLLATLVGGLIAFAAHGGKTAARGRCGSCAHMDCNEASLYRRNGRTVALRNGCFLFTVGNPGVALARSRACAETRGVLIEPNQGKA
jgi:hypothetical protein